jgi:hypothetical protein
MTRWLNMPSFLASREEKHAKRPNRTAVSVAKLDIETLSEKYWKSYQVLKSVHRVAMQFGVTHDSVWKELKKAGYKLNHTKWSNEELDKVRIYYLETSPEIFKLSELAAFIGRTEDAIAIIAGRRLKVTNCNRVASIEAKQKMKIVQKKRCNTPEAKQQAKDRAIKNIQDNGHPRGFKGKRHTDEAKSKISATSKKMWANPNSYQNTQEYRQSISDRVSQSPTLKTSGANLYSRCKRGYRDDLPGIFFRSKWEANIARYYNYLMSIGEIDLWEYEPETFWFKAIKRGVRSYMPDFRITENQKKYYVEVKGWMDNRSKTKLKRMKKYYPDVEIRLLGEKEYRDIKKKMSGVIKCWE